MTGLTFGGSSMKPNTVVAASAVLFLIACSDAGVVVPTPAIAPHAAQAALLPKDGEVVMKKLNNPRGLAFGPDGALYVAEAGKGGPGPCFVALTPQCYGPTGAVGRLRDGVQDTVVSGLPSYANPAGRAEGPNAVALLGMSGAYVTIGLENDPAIRNLAPQFAGFARLVRIASTALVPGHGSRPSGDDWQFVADLGDYEIATNPDCGRIDSNPFAILTDRGGFVIADAGANALIRRAANGDLSTFAAFTSRYTTPQGPQCPTVATDFPSTVPRETVPTSVAVGPDGAYYVGQLAGFPLIVGAAKVYRFERGDEPRVFLTGFTFIVSLAFDTDGNLYVLQHSDGPTAADPGSLIRVAPDGTRTTLVTGLVRPTAVAIGPDGAIYISHRGISVGVGEVLRYAR
jgi:sugar lactone lactonase YvrE